MKLGVTDRLALFIGGVIAILVGLLLAVLSLTGVLAVPGAQQHTTLAKWLLPISGLLLMGYGVYTMALLRRLRRRQESFVVAQTDNGEMRISVRALEDIVKRCVNLQRGIVLRASRVARQRDAVEVEVRITGDPGMDMPQAVSRLQQDIRREMLASAGIRAGDIKVTVDSAPQGRLFTRPGRAVHASGAARVPSAAQDQEHTEEQTGGKANAGT